jgi:23S rRNA (cytidine1920-2'-O)/16S rRNA (cytidine1409-2'-O)-methyltransferase
MPARRRLDKVIVERGLVSSRSRAAALIMAGSVRVDGEVAFKAGMQIADGADIEIEKPLPYVSKGGHKLAHALETFSIDVAGFVCADVGASTGGFTDVLLQRGASKVYAIDVGFGHLAWKLRQDPRVVVIERTNVRYLETLPESVNIVTIDVSFISLLTVLPVVKNWLFQQGEIVALIKPQFEAGPKHVGKGGIVRDKSVHISVLERVLAGVLDSDLVPAGLVPSPLRGSRRNIEFLLWLKQDGKSPIDSRKAIEDAMVSAYRR